MKTKSIAALQAVAKRRPTGYADRVLSAAHRVDHAAGVYEITEEAWEALKGETVEKSPCGNCGDKTNIAQVKASPAAIEAMLSGE